MRTFSKFFQPKIIEKILELGTGPDTKLDVKFQNIKTVLDKQLLHSQQYNLYQDGIKKSASSHNAFRPTERGNGGKQYTYMNLPAETPQIKVPPIEILTMARNELRCLEFSLIEKNAVTRGVSIQSGDILAVWRFT